jgi:hypothetical protein
VSFAIRTSTSKSLILLSFWLRMSSLCIEGSGLGAFFIFGDSRFSPSRFCFKRSGRYSVKKLNGRFIVWRPSGDLEFGGSRGLPIS